MRKGLILLTFTWIFFTGEGFSQESWSLQQCIQYAIQHNIQVKQQEISAKVATNSYQLAKLDLLPALNASAQQSYSFGRSLDMFTNSFNEDNTASNNFQGSASLDIFAGFSKINTIEKNKLNFLASLQDVEKMKNDIALNVAAAFLQVLYAEENLEIAHNQQRITNLQLERTRKLVEAGSLAQGSFLEVQAQLSGEELAVVNASNTVDMAYLQLTQLLEIDDPRNFRIQKPLTTAIDKDIKIRTATSVYDEALQNLPQIKSAELRLKSAGSDLKISRGNYMPRLTMSAMYTTGYSDARQLAILSGMDTIPTGFIPGSPGQVVYGLSPKYSYKNYSFADQIKDNSYRYLTFNLNIPIFNGLSARKSVSNSKLQLENARYNLELTRKQLFKEIQQAEADANAALKNYLAASKSLDAYEESFRYTQQKFDVGMVNSVDFNLSKNQMVKAQSDLIRSKYEYLFKINVLEFYRGNPLSIE